MGPLLTIVNRVKQYFSPRQRVEESQPLQRARMQATYDASRTTVDNSNYWSNTDARDADSANSRSVREILVRRSRYEADNNGYIDGITQTYATDLVGTGPKLRMMSGSPGFNSLVESEWERWSAEVMLRRKLWTMARAKVVDGESFCIGRNNPRTRHPVNLYPVVYETEQCQTPTLIAELEPNRVDGIRFDEFGNPLSYDFLERHPGSELPQMFRVAESIPSRIVFHWFKCKRPGQHRGVPELTSVLAVSSSGRRFREATVAAAESAADFAVMLQTNMPASDIVPVDPMTTTEIEKRMMTALPEGWDANQIKAEHPASTYESFHKTLISESARPLSMPFNKAAADSSSYNYASGRLDHQTYYGELDVARSDCDMAVLTPMFFEWVNEAIIEFGWLGGSPNNVSPGALAHAWDWPRHRVADVVAEANAARTRLESGQTSLPVQYANEGRDFEDELVVMAEAYGLSEDEMRETLGRTLMNANGSQAPYLSALQTAANTGAEPDPSEDPNG